MIKVAFILTETMLSRSSRANEGLRFLFKDDMTKYNSFFLTWAN